ncbi:MAG: hypothetical protein ACR5LG_14445, partial [Sodalis sp. (in: enterobacteria)]|uniref:hypothetical protein n=1 Tax=Sodalis sp. (in: enterobacteria) TaxID=1898979 RepID=UPI003F39F0FC
VVDVAYGEIPFQGVNPHQKPDRGGAGMKQLVKLLPGVYLDPAELSVVRAAGENVSVGLDGAAHFLCLASVAGSVDTVAETLVLRINAVLAEVIMACKPRL